jgi:hypothetical protein
MKVSVEIKGMEAVRARLSGMGKQVAFAASKALNATGKQIADAMPAEIERAIDKPTAFTKKGVRVLKYANKGNLEVTVGFMAAQAKYMEFQTAGGSFTPGKKGLKLPGGITLDSYGNIPRGIIAKLKSAAGGSLVLGGTVERRLGVAGNKRKGAAPVQLFYGIPRGKGYEKWPVGIYRRIPGNPGKLVPIILFPNKTAKYKARFDFQGKAKAIVAREWPAQFDLALADALRTAK